ncbi:anti-sigma factor family protein [Rhizobium paknamense]|uniref:Anti-sigma factor RsiW n=1 Tax=Rhizobium paknamense TaxID=1206817 RepID=A0ABU0IDV1_9HYPH|nr:anti-sigma factor [Rhizobium paknamense]MDQ0456424.1 anti-sigma factor RsiW [Rhizobium paknamense]
MNKQSDPVQDFDLHAYVDDQLPVARRIEVEAYLSGHPDLAARVMGDLRVRDELRLALAGQTVPPRAETRETARRLEAVLGQEQRLAFLRRAAAVVIFVGGGWLAHSAFSVFTPSEVVASVPPPAFVDEAVKAHETAMLRESVSGPTQKAAFGPAEIRSATGIMLPELPARWTVLDSQIFPSAYGPSVEMVVKPLSGGEMSLYAVRPGSFSVQPVTLRLSDKANAAYWQIGEVGYALVAGHQRPDELAATARQLARTLY